MIGLPSAGKHRPRWVALAIAAKVVVVVAFVIVPTRLAVSLGAAHGVALAVFAPLAAVLLIIRWRRTTRPHRGIPHGHSHHHGSDPAPDHRPTAETIGDGEGA